MSQSPSLRGSGRFPSPPAVRRREERVSIPFIAGQWSLPDDDLVRRIAADSSQSPSLRGSGRFEFLGRTGAEGSASQSPSLRGSGRFMEAAVDKDIADQVSIPFIAGQWSLRALPALAPERARSQSPSLRGSGRFWGPPGSPPATFCLNPLHCGAVVASIRKGIEATKEDDMSQSPSLRGSGRFEVPPGPRNRGANVSIPFIAGQWSLPEGHHGRRINGGSQSPSLRGSGRFVNGHS